jgi:hypothetical protein
MRSHFSLPRGVAAVVAVAGTSVALSSTCAAANNLIAADYATNSTYAGGWSAGQNGGYGWGAWSFNGTETTSPNEQAMDHTSPYNPFGVAWTLYNPEGSVPISTFPHNSPGTCYNSPTSTDVSKTGRSFPNGGLQPGQTFSTVLSNPTDRHFFRGYNVVLSTGSDNLDYNHTGSEISVGCFEYFSYGKWTIGDAVLDKIHSNIPTTLFDTDTTTNGVQIDISITGTNTYHAALTPLGHPELAFSTNSAFTNTPTWVTFQQFNTDSDFYPTLAPCGPDRTDLYIKSMTVSGLNLNIQQAGTNVLLSWPSFFSNFTLVSSPNLSAPVWSPAATNASGVVNGQNVVTNSIAGATQQFYRLQFQQ